MPRRRRAHRPSAACIDVVAPPPPAPGAPQNATASLRSVPSGGSGGAAAYPFDEGSGNTTADATGLGHTGTLGTGPSVDSADPAWTTGLSGQALSFDGSNDRVGIADAADLDFAGSFTLEAWIQRAATGAAHCIVSKGDSQRRNFWMLIDSSNRIDFRWESIGGTNHGATSPGIITDTAWHHVACVWDATLSRNRIYVDGVVVQSKSSSGTPVVNNDPVHIGARLSSGSLRDWFGGTIDLVRLSPGAIYSGNFTPPTSFGSGASTDVVDVAWQAPMSGTPAGYFVERQVNAAAFVRLTATSIATLTYTDLAPPAGDLCYRIIAVDAVPLEGPASNTACVIGITKATPQAAPAPLAVERTLSAAPNPFNPTTRLAFRLESASDVSLVIYDARGARVATLARGRHEAGAHLVRWNGAHGGRPSRRVRYLLRRTARRFGAGSTAIGALEVVRRLVRSLGSAVWAANRAWPSAATEGRVGDHSAFTAFHPPPRAAETQSQDGLTALTTHG